MSIEQERGELKYECEALREELAKARALSEKRRKWIWDRVIEPERISDGHGKLMDAFWCNECESIWSEAVEDAHRAVCPIPELIEEDS